MATNPFGVWRALFLNSRGKLRVNTVVNELTVTVVHLESLLLLLLSFSTTRTGSSFVLVLCDKWKKKVSFFAIRWFFFISPGTLLDSCHYTWRLVATSTTLSSVLVLLMTTWRTPRRPESQSWWTIWLAATTATDADGWTHSRGRSFARSFITTATDRSNRIN